MNKRSNKKTITHNIICEYDWEIYSWEIELPFRLNVGDTIQYDMFYGKGLLTLGGEENEELFNYLSEQGLHKITEIIIKYDEIPYIDAHLN
jgi:hypothetical protein